MVRQLFHVVHFSCNTFLGRKEKNKTKKKYSKYGDLDVLSFYHAYINLFEQFLPFLGKTRGLKVLLGHLVYFFSSPEKMTMLTVSMEELLL